MSMPVPPDKSPDAISPGKSMEPVQKPVVPQGGGQGFESYMQGTAGQQTGATAQPPQGMTPMEMARSGTQSPQALSMDAINNQAKTAQDSLGTVGQQLNDPKLKLKRSQSHLVRQKLEDANGYIRAAGAKLGVDTPELKIPPGVSALGRFIAMVNNGQDQLAEVQNKLKELSAHGNQIEPGEMMAIQVKMNLAQQEIEYTSTLLGKVIQSVTQIMNTQL